MKWALPATDPAKASGAAGSARALDAEAVRRIAGAVARRDSSGAPPTGTTTSSGITTFALGDVVGALRERFPEATPEIDAIERIQRDFLEHHGSRLRARAKDGFVRSAERPPLRLHEIEVTPTGARLRPTATDSAGERDVALDLASLTADLAVEGRGDLAERLLSAFAGETNDFGLYGVVDYYERQIALDRALACAEAAQARRWLVLARSTCEAPVVPPMLVCVGGLVASGKSTVAHLLAERMAAPRIEADRARIHLTRDDEARTLRRGFSRVVYEELLRRAGIVLGSGRSAVLDACFARHREREAASRLARARGWGFLFVECRVDGATTRSRLAARDAAAGTSGWRQVYEDLAQRWQPTDDFAPAQRIVLDCTRPLPENEALLLERVPAGPPGSRLP